MTKRVKNHGLIAGKSPNGISVRTTEWGAEVCVSRHDNTLAITIHHDGNDTPTTVEIPLTDNPYSVLGSFIWAAESGGRIK